LDGGVAIDQVSQGLRVGARELREPHNPGLQEVLHGYLVFLAGASLDPDALSQHLYLLGHLAGLIDDRGAELVRERFIVSGERRRMLLDPLRQTPHRLGASLHVALHRLDDPGRLVGDQISVLDDLVLDGAGKRLVALIQVLKCRCDVRLHLLELGADQLDALEGGRVRDLVDRSRRQLDRLAHQTAVLGELGQ
jgi:hypothetical protein